MRHHRRLALIADTVGSGFALVTLGGLAAAIVYLLG